jgi:hypothetical protein
VRIAFRLDASKLPSWPDMCAGNANSTLDFAPDRVMIAYRSANEIHVDHCETPHRSRICRNVIVFQWISRLLFPSMDGFEELAQVNSSKKMSEIVSSIPFHVTTIPVQLEVMACTKHHVCIPIILTGVSGMIGNFTNCPDVTPISWELFPVSSYQDRAEGTTARTRKDITWQCGHLNQRVRLH